MFLTFEMYGQIIFQKSLHIVGKKTQALEISVQHPCRF